MKNEFDNKAADPRGAVDSPIEDEEYEDHTFETIMEIFSMIMHKVYKFAPDALAYNVYSDDDENYSISFRHSDALDIDDLVLAANFDKDFYRDMRAFLQGLDALEPDLEISPNELTIEAPNLLCLIDALDLYFKQDDCPLKTADHARISLPQIDPHKPGRIRAAMRRMAKEGHDLARNERDSYEYFLLSTSSQPFVSLDHYFASIAARAKSDVPLSLDLLRKDAAAELIDHYPMYEHEQRTMLEDSFMGCARWHVDAPNLPDIKDGVPLLQREMQRQLANVVQSLLISNYNLNVTSEIDAVHTIIKPVAENCFDMDFSCLPTSAPKIIAHHFKAFQEFGDTFKKAAGNSGAADLRPVRDHTLMTIRYFPEGLFEAITNMAIQFHPENLIAQRHLRSIVHIKERLNLNAPANALN